MADTGYFQLDPDGKFREESAGKFALGPPNGSSARCSYCDGNVGARCFRFEISGITLGDFTDPDVIAAIGSGWTAIDDPDLTLYSAYDLGDSGGRCVFTAASTKNFISANGIAVGGGRTGFPTLKVVPQPGTLAKLSLYYDPDLLTNVALLQVYCNGVLVFQDRFTTVDGAEFDCADGLFHTFNSNEIVLQASGGSVDVYAMRCCTCTCNPTDFGRCAGLLCFNYTAPDPFTSPGSVETGGGPLDGYAKASGGPCLGGGAGQILFTAQGGSTDGVVSFDYRVNVGAQRYRDSSGECGWIMYANLVEQEITLAIGDNGFGAFQETAVAWFDDSRYWIWTAPDAACFPTDPTKWTLQEHNALGLDESTTIDLTLSTCPDVVPTPHPPNGCDDTNCTCDQTISLTALLDSVESSHSFNFCLNQIDGIACHWEDSTSTDGAVGYIECELDDDGNPIWAFYAFIDTGVWADLGGIWKATQPKLSFDDCPHSTGWTTVQTPALTTPSITISGFSTGSSGCCAPTWDCSSIDKYGLVLQYDNGLHGLVRFSYTSGCEWNGSTAFCITNNPSGKPALNSGKFYFDTSSGHCLARAEFKWGSGANHCTYLFSSDAKRTTVAYSPIIPGLARETPATSGCGSDTPANVDVVDVRPVQESGSLTCAGCPTTLTATISGGTSLTHTITPDGTHCSGNLAVACQWCVRFTSGGHTWDFLLQADSTCARTFTIFKDLSGTPFYQWRQWWEPGIDCPEDGADWWLVANNSGDGTQPTLTVTT